jgi:hypothetical protein
VVSRTPWVTPRARVHRIAARELAVQPVGQAEDLGHLVELRVQLVLVQLAQLEREPDLALPRRQLCLGSWSAASLGSIA